MSRAGIQISGQVGDKVLYEYLGIEFSLTPLEMETVFWNAASMGAIMPDADKMLDVWYDNDTEKDYKDRSNEHLPQCEHLHIYEWNEMINLLERIS